MSAEAYELLAAAARYWFALLGAVILALAARAVYYGARGDASRSKEERPLLTLRLLSDADKALDADFSVEVCVDGTAGRGRVCDARIRHKGIERRHAAFKAARGGGASVIPVGGAFVAVNGEQVTKPHAVAPGDKVQLGPLVFRAEMGGVDVEA